jgi:hypothetical protein
MSWAELERFVGDAESNGELRQILRSCQSQAELLLAARIRGYHITRIDLLRAWQEHKGLSMNQASSG